MTVPDPSTELATLAAALADRYAVERELGVGGMATVYLATDRKHGRQVAIKVLRSEAAEAVGAERFLREIEIAANLRHPHILPLYDSGQAGSLLYYVMPYVEGESLRDRLRREKQLSLDDAVRLTREIADALAFAHGRGVVHRDIKPENILLESGHAVIADFGIARALSAAGGQSLTMTGLAIGTPAYMSPEQASGETGLDARSDQYSLACVSFEMLAGQPPFTGPTSQSLIHQHIVATAPTVTQLRPEIPASIASALARALAKNPADRFATTAQFADQIQETAATSAGIVTRSRPRRWMVGTAILVLLALIGTLAGVWRGAREPVTGAVADSVPSIAVLAFSDLSEDKSSEYLGDGIAETLINALGSIEGLRVAARTSAFTYKGRDADVRTIGSQLGVRTVLQGSVQRAGTRLRVSAQLIDAATGFQMWSDQYNRTTDDVFAVQDDVARSIVKALAIKLGPDSQRIVRHGTASLAAYDAYLLGRFHWNKRTVADMQQAVHYFERAIAADSSFAAAWAGLADAYALSTPRDFGPPDANVVDMLNRARQAAERALALDPRAGEPHATLGLVASNRKQWDEAERHYEHAIERNPRYAPAHQWYSALLLQRGKLDAAVSAGQRAAAIEPLSPIIGVQLGTTLSVAGRMPEASAQLERVTQLHPDFANGHFRAWMHAVIVADFARAATHFQRLLELTGVAADLASSTAERLRGEPSRSALLRALADSTLADQLGPLGTDAFLYVTAPTARVAAYRVAYGKDSTVDFLLRFAANPRNLDYLYINNLLVALGPELRADPRLQATLRELGAQ